MRKFSICRGYEDAGVVLPKRSTRSSAGYDFSSLEDYSLKPGECHVFQTGVKAQMEEDDVLYIFIRSSMAIKRGLELCNSVGVIDADYFGNPSNDGHIMIAIFNSSSEVASIRKGDKIAQGIFMKYEKTDDDDASLERVGGTGSTGR